MPDLLRYQVIAVLQYSFTPDALYLRHLRQLQNLGIAVLANANQEEGRAMRLMINNKNQSLNFIKKQMGPVGAVEENKTTGENQNRNFDLSGDPKDTVEILSFRKEVESNRVSLETDDKNADEVKKLLNFAITLLSSESDKSRLEKIYGFKQENIVKLLSV